MTRYRAAEVLTAGGGNDNKGVNSTAIKLLKTQWEKIEFRAS